jgi:nitrite reductase/ring-hydroxylating ferredoxin subunit
MFVRVAPLDDLWTGEMKSYRIEGQRVLVIRHDAGVSAYPDRCAHLGVALSEGALENGVVTCRAHGWQYDGCTGAGINPAQASLRRYPAAVEDGFILVDVSDPVPAGARGPGDQGS